MKTEWISISVDKKLIERIKKLIQKEPYKSPSDFIGKVTLDRVEHLEDKHWEEEQLLREVRERKRGEAL